MINCSGIVFAKILKNLKLSDYTGYTDQYPPFGSWSDLKNKNKTIFDAWKWVAQDKHDIDLFVNVPFCKVKCSFCFLPVICTGHNKKNIDKTFDSYLEYLQKEISLLAPIFKKRTFNSLYIGGGTPSMMSVKQIEKFFALLRKNFKFSAKAQILAEISPEIGQKELTAFKKCGINRLCIGVQTMSPQTLHEVQREQKNNSFERTYKLAKKTGIKKINVDLICGLPNQSDKSFIHDLKTVAALRPDQIHLNIFATTPYTIYSLKGGKAINEKKIKKLREKGFNMLFNLGYKKLDSDAVGLTLKSKNFQTADLREKKSLLGIGIGSVSRAWSRLRYINTIDWAGYRRNLSSKTLPAKKGIQTSLKDEMIHFILESLNFEPAVLLFKDFKGTFKKDLPSIFSDELKELKNRGIFVDKT
ncbi:MAG: radical SAM protein, partial [Elusimicrobiota bacterium]|nr:radical SAM protein [Elusimicrobiota bacterium]